MGSVNDNHRPLLLFKTLGTVRAPAVTAILAHHRMREKEHRAADKHGCKFVKKSNNLQSWRSEGHHQNSVNCIIGN